MFRPLEEEHEFLLYLKTYIIERQPISNIETISKKMKVVKLSGKSFAFSMGLLSGIPYIEVARQFAGGYTVIGYILAYGMVGALASVTTWALLDVVNSFDAPENKISIKYPKKSKFKEAIYWIITPSLGFSSAIPMGYVGYKYNGDSVFFAFVSLFSEFVTNTCSLNRVFRNLGTDFSYCRKNLVKNLMNIRDKMVDYVNVSIEILILMNNEVRIEFLTDYQPITTNYNLSAAESLFYNLIRISQNQAEIRRTGEQCGLGMPIIFVKILSLIFPIAWSIISFQLAFASSKYLVDNFIVNLFVSIFSVSPGFLLELNLAQSVFILMYSSVTGYLYNTYNKNFPQAYYPRINAVLTFIGLSTAFLAFGSRAKVVLDNVNGDEKYLLMALSIISTISYKSSAMLSLVRDVIEYGASKLGDNNKKRLYEDLYYLRKFSTFISSSKLNQIDKFLCGLNLEALKDIVGKNSIFFNEVISYTIVRRLDSSERQDDIEPDEISRYSPMVIRNETTQQTDETTGEKQFTLLFNKKKQDKAEETRGRLLSEVTEEEVSEQSNFSGKIYPFSEEEEPRSR